MVTFVDYRNPSSAYSLGVLRNSLRAMPAGTPEVELVVHDYPIDSHCSDIVSGERNSAGIGCDTAAAIRLVRAARGEEATQAMIGWVFAKGSGLSATDIREHLTELGVIAAFDLRRDELLSDVAEDSRLARRFGVSRVPAVFVDGIETPSGYAQVAIYYRAGLLKSLPPPG